MPLSLMIPKLEQKVFNSVTDAGRYLPYLQERASFFQKLVELPDSAIINLKRSYLEFRTRKKLLARYTYRQLCLSGLQI
jgi:hypothetical protein